jgi:hypothetical protein
MVRITLALILALSAYDVLADDYSRLQACVKAYAGKSCPDSYTTLGATKIKLNTLARVLDNTSVVKYCQCREAYAPKRAHNVCLAWSRACEFGDI